MRLSDTGKLRSLELLAFATHGDLQGAGIYEPGVVLSQTESDSMGFLGISDIARLHMSVNLLVLSACSTADSAGMGVSVRQLPTIAESFAEVGAKSILATLTTVESAAAREISTRVVQYAQPYPDRGIAWALQQVTLQEIANGRPPEFWAPFAFLGRD